MRKRIQPSCWWERREPERDPGAKHSQPQPKGGKPFVSLHCGACRVAARERAVRIRRRRFYRSKKRGSAGRFEMAHTGTLFLDEIDTTPLNVQTRLLRCCRKRRSCVWVEGTRFRQHPDHCGGKSEFAIRLQRAFPGRPFLPAQRTPHYHSAFERPREGYSRPAQTLHRPVVRKERT